jgi:tRNA 2-selenouridine synthase SelU
LTSRLGERDKKVKQSLKNTLIRQSPKCKGGEMKPIDILTNGKHSENIVRGICNGCGKKIDIKNEFKNAISRKEYLISGFCQICQDEVFGKD